MKQWEYTALNANASFSEIDRLGKKGWEMVGVSADKIYFKRPYSEAREMMQDEG